MKNVILADVRMFKVIAKEMRLNFVLKGEE